MLLQTGRSRRDNTAATIVLNVATVNGLEPLSPKRYSLSLVVLVLNRQCETNQ